MESKYNDKSNKNTTKRKRNEENMKQKKYTFKIEFKNLLKKKIEVEDIPNNREWKEKNIKYLKELQLFFDRVDSIRDSNLKTSIINQMLQCDKALTEIAEEMFLKCYKKGYKQAKEE